MTPNKQCPCKDCTTRSTGNDEVCHAKCKAYLDWRKMYNEFNAKKFREQKTKSDADAVKSEKQTKLRKWLGWKKGGGQR